MSRRAEAINQEIALQPDGIVLGTVDAYEQAAEIGPLPRQAVVVVDRPCSSPSTSGSTASRKDLDSGYPEAYKNLWSVQ